MRRRRTVILMLSLVTPVGARAAEPATDANVRLQVLLTVKNGEYLLGETLTSADSRPFVLQSSELPWGEGRSLHLDTFIPDSRGAKLASSPLGPPPRGEIVLEAGRSLSGELNLNKVFIGLERMLDIHPVIIHWAYQFRATRPAAAAGWQAGSFVIPKGGLVEGVTLH